MLCCAALRCAVLLPRAVAKAGLGLGLGRAGQGRAGQGRHARGLHEEQHQQQQQQHHHHEDKAHRGVREILSAQVGPVPCAVGWREQ